MKTIDKVLIPFLSLVFMGLVGASYYIYTVSQSKIDNIQHISTNYSNSKFLFADKYDRADEILCGMTLEEKVGQMIFARVPEINAEIALNQYNLGGYILFARDFEGETLESAKQKIENFQNAAKTKMLIGVDEEGGVVSRLSYTGLVNPAFASPMEIYNSEGLDGIEREDKRKIEILKNLGVNVNFAPVADVSSDETSFIFPRTIGKDAEETAKYIEKSVKDYKDSGVSATLKHFPGYGANLDTHTGVAVDERSLEEFRKRDFLPFRAGIEAGAELVMVAHNIISQVDSEYPASISPEIHKILRNELGFSGLIVTDDMAMGAITEYKGGEPEVQAVLAGNNLIITSDFASSYAKILNAVQTGVISEDIINDAVRMIIAYKIEKGLIL